ncbi:hypothetical protein pipiens_010268 [Culex pipiens pipiens]|uniref:Pickpocket n=1 Tax=Culex pipiens pipiens TaxID=38569 RepID=A0ABD1DBW6_CULPP
MKRSKLKPLRSGLKDLLLEYCSGSSIHGVQYMGSQNRSWCERFWWMVVFAMSVGSCAFLIHQTYDKWDQTPVIVSFAEKSTPVWQIPFPAVTICPQTKVDINLFNFTKEFEEFKQLALEDRLLHNRTIDADIDYLCRGPVQGFKVLFHSPADYPQISKKFFHIPMDAAVNMAIKPQMITTNARLRAYTPELRHCFFNHERYLQFFRVYSQDNCELECLTNYTLRHCGCVKFSMPRTNQTRICDPAEIDCMFEAESILMEMDLTQHRENSAEGNFRANCNCLPGCTSIQYDAEITQTDFEWMNWVRSMKGKAEKIESMQLSYLGIYYKEPQFMTSKRSELYGMTDFLANCGGIMGLCMGISLLSLVELVYFCSVRPAMLYRGNRKRKRKSRKLKKEECAEVCLQEVVVKSD